MILPDLNTLIHSYNSDSPLHEPARLWWESLMSNTIPVGLAWVVILGFIRITTHRTILQHPLPVESACGHARSWLAQPQVSVIHPGEQHADLLFHLLQTVGAAGNLTTDAHLAALAIEYHAELHTTDADFARFPGLKWSHPFR